MSIRILLSALQAVESNRRVSSCDLQSTRHRTFLQWGIQLRKQSLELQVQRTLPCMKVRRQRRRTLFTTSGGPIKKDFLANKCRPVRAFPGEDSWLTVALAEGVASLSRYNCESDLMAA